MISTTPAELTVATAEAMAIDAEPQMRDLVDEAETSFMMRDETAFRFVRKLLPPNRLVAHYQATTVEELEKILKNGPAPELSKTVKIAAGITSAGISVLAGTATAITGIGIIVGAMKIADVGDTVGNIGALILVGSLLLVTYGCAVATSATYDKSAPKIEQWFSGFSPSQLEKAKSFLTDPTNRANFFALNPEAYVKCLKESTSSAFRQKEAEARSRIDMLTIERRAKAKRQEDLERSIKASDHPKANKESLLATTGNAAQEGLRKLDEAIAEEEAFAKKLDGIVQEVVTMAAEISHEVEMKNVVERVSDFKKEMEDVDETVARAEQARIRAVIDLAGYWERLREIGDEVIHLAQAHQELSLQLLNPPKTDHPQRK